MTPLDVLQIQINEWANQAFPNRTDSSILLKLYEEIGEMVKNPSDADEHADVFILLLDFATRHGIDVEKAVKDKLAINKNREWELDIGTGVMRHVE